MKETLAYLASAKNRDLVLATEVNAARDRLGDRRGRLEWALRFAQQDLTRLPPGSLADLRRELAAIVGTPAKRGQVELLSLAEMQELQIQFLQHVKELAQKGESTWGPFEAVWRIQRAKGPTGKEEIAFGYDMKFPGPDFVSRAAFQLALLLVGQQPVKVCHAPKVWGKAGEECGTLFLGRPDQEFCSTRCQTRKGTRTLRNKRRDQALAKGRRREKVGG